MIHKLGYSAYFLTVSDIAADIRAMGIRCACRGSAAGSLVCYLTRISDVDPIHHGLIFERFINHLRDAIEHLPELVGSNMNAGQLELLFCVAERLNGFPRHLALHPSGIVLSKNDLVERVPLERSFQGYRMVHADKDDVELLGYLKLDVLGVRMLSAMRHCLDEIVRVDHEKVDVDAIPLGD